MDKGSSKLRLVTWTVMNLLCVFSYEVTVKNSDLKLCEEDERVCVTDIEDCGPRPPTSVQKNLNMSCYYEISQKSITCEWVKESDSHTESDVSLIFSSEDPIFSCQGLFFPAAFLNITARIKNYMTGIEIWSQPYAVFLYDAIKPSRPVLTLLDSTEDSISVSWRSSSSGSCRLRYRVNHTHTWTQASDSVPVNQDEEVNYAIKGLLPFTVYRAAVACKEESDIWSDWSSEVSARTLDRVPSKPPEVCYRVEKPDSGGSLHLHLTWMDLNLHDAGGRILGYQVSYEPAMRRQLQDKVMKNFTDVTAQLVLEGGNWSVTVAAFNTAGFGPSAHLSIDTQRRETVPSVRDLWVSSSFPAVKGLLVQWQNITASPSVHPVSHFVVQWRSETRPSTSHWTTVDNFTTSTLIQDVDPDDSYLVSVFPVYNQRCGSPQSLPASLQQGALMEAVKMKVLGVTKTTVTAVWAWQRKSGPIRVNRYRLMLRKDSEKQTLSLWPDQWQHTVLNLKPNTEYSLLLLADNVSRTIIPIRTDFDEVPALVIATPLLLLAVTVLFIAVLSRTVYKSYFFPPISSPHSSTAGRWLMDPNLQKSAERNILDIEDFQVTDILTSLIVVGQHTPPPSEEDPHEDPTIKLSALELDPEYVSDAPINTEHRLVSPQTCRRPDRELREADLALCSCFLFQKEEESRQVISSVMSHHKEVAATSRFREFMANANTPCVYQMTCETEYVVSSSFLEKSDVETVGGHTDRPYLICDIDYIANSCFAADPTDENKNNNALHAGTAE